MGLFDTIDLSDSCPYCGALITDFQSISGPCTMEILKPWAVNDFYSACPDCEKWVHYHRKSRVGTVKVEEPYRSVEHFVSFLLDIKKNALIGHMYPELITKLNLLLKSAGYSENWKEDFELIR